MVFMETYIQKLIDEKAEIFAFVNLWNDKTNCELLNHYLKSYIVNNKQFSIEEFHKIVKQDRGYCSMYFIPTSKSYNEFGMFVTITRFICSDEESKLYQNNWQNKQLTYGTFKAIQRPEPDVVPYGKEIEISTYDIYSIEYSKLVY